MRKPAAISSLAIHAAAIVLLFLITFKPSPRPSPIPGTVPRLEPRLQPPRLFLKNGGGGQRQKQPASRGRAPTLIARKVWTPPAIVRVENPKLVVEQALLETPEINIQSSVTGDPLGRAGMPSAGSEDPPESASTAATESAAATARGWAVRRMVHRSNLARGPTGLQGGARIFRRGSQSSISGHCGSGHRSGYQRMPGEHPRGPRPGARPG